jgi:CubicO group peptidase (beta-lactamase class C family)
MSAPSHEFNVIRDAPGLSMLESLCSPRAMTRQPTRLRPSLAHARPHAYVGDCKLRKPAFWLNIRRIARISVLLLLIPAAATAQNAPPTPYDRSIAAGYKALMLCGAVFNGGRTQEQAEQLELTGIYPEYDAIVPTLKARVELGGALDGVAVEFDPALPPRYAHFEPGRGCTIDPLGTLRLGGLSSLDDTANLPKLDRSIKASPAQSPALAAVIARAFDPATVGRTTGVVVMRDGKIVGERYARGFTPETSQRTWSVAKSISGTLIGIATRDHLVEVTQPAFPVQGDWRREITLDNLLRMASGLHGFTPGNRTDALYFGGTTVEQEAAVTQLEVASGTRFRYANFDILLAIRKLRDAIHDDARYNAFPQKELFARLGMTRTIAEQDLHGNFILSSQVWSTARDLARLGQFWLQDGVWQGERILPEGWMKYMTTPGGPQPPKGTGYGATMWLLGPKEGLPEGSYAAEGNRGQFVVVIPSRNIVVVRRGEDATGAAFDMDKFTADVLAALQ